MRFNLEGTGTSRIYESKYLPDGTCFFVNNGQTEQFINWLKEAESMHEEIIRLKNRNADLEYQLRQIRSGSHP